MKKAASYLGLTIVFIWFMPPYLPWHLEIVYLSGALEVLFAAMLILPGTRQLAGNLLIALTLAVTPAHIHMWLNPELFPEVEPLFLSLHWPSPLTPIASWENCLPSEGQSPPDTVAFLTLEKVLKIHTMLLREFGGPPGVRDMGLLESAK